MTEDVFSLSLSDLLTIPPGFTEGVTFTQPGVQEEAPLQPSSSQPRPHVVSVAELLSGGGAQLNWFEVADEEEEEEGGAEGEEEARAEEKRGSGQRVSAVGERLRVLGDY